MTYSKSSSEKFTLIDDLLDLDNPKEQEKFKDFLPNGQEDKYSKFIRQPHKSKYEDNIPNNISYNMNNIPNNMSHNNNNIHHGMNNMHHGVNNMHHSMNNMHHSMNNMHHSMNNMPVSEEIINESYKNGNSYNIPMNSPYSCLDVSGHIENCPICSKFYNNDKSVFIITIIILVIICIILLKKVLEK